MEVSVTHPKDGKQHGGHGSKVEGNPERGGEVYPGVDC